MARKHKVPIEVSDRNPFGDEIDEEALNDPGRDVTFLPGYSDVRRNKELAEREGYETPPLKHRYHWVKSQRMSGAEDRSKVAEWKAKGYRMVSWDEAKNLGIDLENSAAARGEGGEVRLGDTVLMVAGQKAAATEYAKWQRANKNQWDERVRGPLEDAAAEANRRMGLSGRGATSIDFEVEPGTPPKKSKK